MLKSFENPIYVTQPVLPDLSEVNKKLENIWKSKWLTNHGEFHNKFEQRLCKTLKVNNSSLFNNGTIALLTAIKALYSIWVKFQYAMKPI